MTSQKNLWCIVLAVLITAVIVGGGSYYFQMQQTDNILPVDDVTTKTEPEFRSLLSQKQYNNLPYGASEIEGYYVTVEQSTSFDGSTLDMTCSALVVTNGPSILLESLNAERFGTPPTVVIGSKDSYLGNINKSTKENPIKLLVTLNPEFEGELIGCMSWPFDSISEVN